MRREIERAVHHGLLVIPFILILSVTGALYLFKPQIDRWEERERESVHVVFSAHSLPQRIIAAGDPYDRQVRETAALIGPPAPTATRRPADCVTGSFPAPCPRRTAPHSRSLPTRWP